MNDGQVIIALMRQSLAQPREAAETLLSLGVPRAALWPAFLALVTLSVLLMYLLPLAHGGAGELPPPFVMAGLTAAVSAGSIWMIWKVGVGMGGTGRFDEALLLTVFLQGILFAGQVAELAISLILPPFGAIFGLALVLLAIWLNVNFIAALHGFASLWKALGVLVLASFLLAMALIFVLALTGMPMMDMQ